MYFFSQIEYILQEGTDDTHGQNVIPGTVWGFQTRAYPDLTVTSVTLPDSAFTGQDVTVEWTVENIGKATFTLRVKVVVVLVIWKWFQRESTGVLIFVICCFRTTVKAIGM